MKQPFLFLILPASRFSNCGKIYPNQQNKPLVILIHFPIDTRRSEFRVLYAQFVRPTQLNGKRCHDSRCHRPLHLLQDSRIAQILRGWIFLELAFVEMGVSYGVSYGVSHFNSSILDTCHVNDDTGGYKSSCHPKGGLMRHRQWHRLKISGNFWRYKTSTLKVISNEKGGKSYRLSTAKRCKKGN